MLPSETKAFWLQLGALGVAMSIGFMGWFLHATDRPPAPARGKLVQSPEATAPQGITKEFASPSAPWPAVPSGDSAPPRVPASDPAPDTRAAAASLPNAPIGNFRPLAKPAAANASAASPRELSRDSQIQAVEDFYRALAAADGRTAAALVVPAKRGLGPFNEANISRFYGSFARPLIVRSIRSIDASAVEAKYSYRVSRTTCEGTAIVETERVGQQTLIRRIRANC